MSQSNPPSTFPPLFGNSIVLTGATASGKSRVAMELADRIGGEILSLDSIAVYRFMDIGTAKPSLDDQARTPHHLIDLADPDQDFSVACYLAAAHESVKSVINRGKQPIFVGGTPMFLKAVLRGFDAGPPPDWEFRESVQRDIEQFGTDALRQRLVQVDPVSASRIDPGDTRRMIRALEFSLHTGVPLSHRQVQFDHAASAEECNVFALRHERSHLHERINQRVVRMFDHGLVDEVKQLVERFGSLSRTASQAVGYREVIEWIPTESPINEVIELVSAHTRQMARRQETWFRSFSEITTLDLEPTVDETSVVDDICQHINQPR